jgi:ATP-dependent protease ClpP protease subunit
MGSWSEYLYLCEQSGNPIAYLNDKRFELLDKISVHVGRNVIAYYSGWLTKPHNADIDINDSDKNAFMQAVYKMDKSKGLDLILHTPGGGIAAAESIVEYLHSIFNGDIRAIIPQMAMSAGTMIALSCHTIIMGKHSSLGPVDPQNRGISCQEALEEFDTAKEEISKNPSSLGLWQVLISKYTPTFLTSCKHAVDWSKAYTSKWVCNNRNIKPENGDKILNLFAEHKESKSHDRHISVDKCKEVGLNIIELENDQYFQDLILSLHHCYMILFDKSIVVKAVENQLKAAYLRIYNNQPSVQ